MLNILIAVSRRYKKKTDRKITKAALKHYDYTALDPSLKRMVIFWFSIVFVTMAIISPPTPRYLLIRIFNLVTMGLNALCFNIKVENLQMK